MDTEFLLELWNTLKLDCSNGCTTLIILGFPGGTSGKEPTYRSRRDVRDVGSIPGSGRSSGGDLLVVSWYLVVLVTHSSILAWRISWTEEPSRLWFIGPQRIGHDWSDLSREGYGTPLQYSCLETPMDRGAWWAAVHGVAKSRTRLSDFTFSFHFHALEKEMASHSSVLAWRIPGTAEPGGLLSMRSQSQARLKQLSSSSRSDLSSTCEHTKAIL